MDTNLNKESDEITRCKKCGICLAECPVYSETLDETISPRGKIAISQAINDGKLKPTLKTLDTISKCLSCYSCMAVCPNDIKVVDILSSAKGRIVSENRQLKLLHSIIESGLRKPAIYSGALNLINRFIAIYKVIPENFLPKSITPFILEGKKRYFPQIKNIKEQSDKLPVIKIERPVKRIIFFGGCMAKLTDADATEDILKFLSLNNVEIYIPPGLTCCGAPFFYQGDKPAASRLAFQNYSLISKLIDKVDFILTGCATCSHALKRIYPELLVKDGVDLFSSKVLDVQKFIATELPPLTTQKMNNQSNRRVKVTYHDPCHLKRGQGIFLEPRYLLKSIPDLEYIEMKYADLCCGGGGSFSFKNYEMSNRIAKKKIDAIKETGANIVATGCPLCRVQLSDAAKRAGLDIEVVNTVQLLRRYSNAR